MLNKEKAEWKRIAKPWLKQNESMIEENNYTIGYLTKLISLWEKRIGNLKAENALIKKRVADYRKELHAEGIEIK